ncbi:UbiA family prenyltransferase, partial [Aquipuribacter nitratireducens]
MSATWRDWAELVRLPAVVTVPGDVLVGLAAGDGPRARAGWALPLSSVALYWAGMALNDWADRDLDAEERPERPLPSGRVAPTHALGAAAGLTAAGVGVAALAGGRRPAAVAAGIGAAVWLYDLAGKRGPLAPVSMALTRSLDVLLGAAASRQGTRAALLPALAVGLHTLAVTDLSRGEVHGSEPVPATRAQVATLAAAGGSVAVAGAGARSAWRAGRPWQAAGH